MDTNNSAATYRSMMATMSATIQCEGRTTADIARHLRFAFQRLILSSEATKSLEIGAFEAGFSRWFKQEFSQLSAIAYEANPYVFEQFEQEVRALGVDYIHAAVGERNGSVEFLIPDDYRGTKRKRNNQMSSLLANDSTVESHPVTVDMVQLDQAIAPTADDRFVMWVDVEGATEQVFAGAQRSLERCVMMHIEVEARPIWKGQWLDTDVFNFLSGIGFVPVLRDVQGINQYNVIYLNSNLIDPARFAPFYGRFLRGSGEFAPINA